MLRTPPVALLFLLLIWGCSILENSDTNAEKELPPAPVSENPTQPAPSDISAAVAPIPDNRDKAGESATAAIKIPSKVEIRLIQARLKKAGFDPGPVDGILGPKTRAALVRLRSGCSTLGDLLGSSAPDLLHRSISTQTLPPAGVSNNAPGRQETRVLQVRLKEAGFDPGPIDGISGPKTKAALARLQSGCAVFSDHPGILPKQVQTENQPLPESAPRKQVRSATAKAPSFAASISDNAAESIIAEARPTSKKEIRLMQARLKKAGFDPGPVDGILGPKTRAALEKYQASRGLTTAGTLSSVSAAK